MSKRVEINFCFCLRSLEAKDPERVSAGVEPPRGVRPGSDLLRLSLLLPVLQTATGWTLQTAALQTSKYGQVCSSHKVIQVSHTCFLEGDGKRTKRLTISLWPGHQFGVQCLAQRHVYVLAGGAWDQTTNP